MFRFGFVYTSYHHALIDSIDKKIEVISLMRTSGAFILHNLTCIFKVFSCILKLNAEDNIIVSHPFHPAGIFLFVTCKNIYLLDDGIAYYNNSVLPKNYKIKFYRLLIYLKHRVILNAYCDIFELPNIKGVYLVRPEFLFKNSLLNTKNFSINKIDFISNKKNKTFKKDSILFLDTTKDDYKSLNIDKILVYDLLIKHANRIGASIEVKPHPSSEKSNLIDLGLKKSDLNKDLACHLDSFQYKTVYGYLSTGLLLIKLCYPEIDVISLVTKDCLPKNNNIITVFLNIGVKICEI